MDDDDRLYGMTQEEKDEAVIIADGSQIQFFTFFEFFGKMWAPGNVYVLRSRQGRLLMEKHIRLKYPDNDPTCQCVTKGNGERCRKGCENRRLGYECTEACEEKMLCQNRNMTKGLDKKLRVIGGGAKGQGLQVCEPVRKGHHITQYGGEVFADPDNPYVDSHYAAILIPCQNRANSVVVDPTVIGNGGSYINNGHNPNCRVMPMRVGNEIMLSVRATRDIQPGEELAWWYGEEYADLGIDCCGCGDVVNCPDCLRYFLFRANPDRQNRRHLKRKNFQLAGNFPLPLESAEQVKKRELTEKEKKAWNKKYPIDPKVEWWFDEVLVNVKKNSKKESSRPSTAPGTTLRDITRPNPAHIAPLQINVDRYGLKPLQIQVDRVRLPSPSSRHRRSRTADPYLRDPAVVNLTLNIDGKKDKSSNKKKKDESSRARSKRKKKGSSSDEAAALKASQSKEARLELASKTPPKKSPGISSGSRPGCSRNAPMGTPQNAMLPPLPSTTAPIRQRPVSVIRGTQQQNVTVPDKVVCSIKGDEKKKSPPVPVPKSNPLASRNIRTVARPLSRPPVAPLPGRNIHPLTVRDAVSSAKTALSSSKKPEEQPCSSSQAQQKDKAESAARAVAAGALRGRSRPKQTGRKTCGKEAHTSDEISELEVDSRKTSRSKDKKKKKSKPRSPLPSHSASSEFDSNIDEYPEPLDRDLAISARPRMEKWGLKVNKVTGKAGVRPTRIEEAPPGARINPIRQQVIDALKQAKVDTKKIYQEGVDCVPYKLHKRGRSRSGRDQDLAYKCIHCGEYFGDRYTYKRHLERALQTQDVPCLDPDCEDVFNNEPDMRRHYRIHQNQEDKVRYECRTCNRTFANGFGVLNHMQPKNPNGCPFRHYRRISPEGTKTYGGKREHSPTSDDLAIAEVEEQRQERAYLRAERDAWRDLLKDEKAAAQRNQNQQEQSDMSESSTESSTTESDESESSESETP